MSYRNPRPVEQKVARQNVQDEFADASQKSALLVVNALDAITGPTNRLPVKIAHAEGFSVEIRFDGQTDGPVFGPHIRVMGEKAKFGFYAERGNEYAYHASVYVDKITADHFRKITKEFVAASRRSFPSLLTEATTPRGESDDLKPATTTAPAVIIKKKTARTIAHPVTESIITSGNTRPVLGLSPIKPKLSLKG